MQPHSDETQVSKTALWTGRILTVAVTIFLLGDGVMKLIPLDIVVETSRQLGITPGHERLLGGLTLVCTILYAFPRTNVLGAILLTGYLGGAVATHLRAGSPVFTHLLFGVYLGIGIWAALYLRDARVRRMLPFRK